MCVGGFTAHIHVTAELANKPTADIVNVCRNDALLQPRVDPGADYVVVAVVVTFCHVPHISKPSTLFSLSTKIRTSPTVPTIMTETMAGINFALVSLADGLLLGTITTTTTTAPK